MDEDVAYFAPCLYPFKNMHFIQFWFIDSTCQLTWHYSVLVLACPRPYISVSGIYTLRQKEIITLCQAVLSWTG